LFLDGAESWKFHCHLIHYQIMVALDNVANFGTETTRENDIAAAMQEDPRTPPIPPVHHLIAILPGAEKLCSIVGAA
jgi:hypothetical protein